MVLFMVERVQKLARYLHIGGLERRIVVAILAISMTMHALSIIVVQMLPYHFPASEYPPRVIGFNLYSFVSHYLSLTLVDDPTLWCGNAMGVDQSEHMLAEMLKLFPFNILGSTLLLVSIRLLFLGSTKPLVVRFGRLALLLVVAFWAAIVISFEIVGITEPRGWGGKGLRFALYASVVLGPAALIVLAFDLGRKVTQLEADG